MPVEPAEIVAAARSLADRGEDPTVAAVAREAGVSRSAVYRAFPDRAALDDALRASGVPLRAPRELLLDACGALLRSDGPQGLTLAAVAEAAGVGEATLYRTFGDRDGLLGAWARERSPRRLANQLADLSGPPRESLVLVLAEGIRFARAHPALVTWMVAGTPEPALEPLRGGPDSARRALARILGRLEEQGELAPGEAERVRMLLFGSVLAFARPEVAEADPEDLARWLVERALGGR